MRPAHRLLQRHPADQQCASSCSGDESRSAAGPGVRSRARKTRIRSVLMPGRGEVVGQHPPVRGPVPGLLQQFPPRGDQQRLAGDVPQAGREAPRAAGPTGCRYCRIIRTRPASSRATTATAPGCSHHLPGSHVAVRHAGPVGAQRDDPAPELLGGGDHRPLRPVRPAATWSASAAGGHALAAAGWPWPASAEPALATGPAPAPPRPGRRTAGAAGSAGTGTPGGPGWPRRTGGARAAARRTRPGGRRATGPEQTSPACSSASR